MNVEAEIAMLRAELAAGLAGIERFGADESGGVPPMPVFGGGGDMDYSDFAFGFSLDPDGDNTAAVQINAGEIDRITVASAKIVVTDDYFVYVRRTIFNDTMLIATAASVPANSATYLYYRLYQFTVTDGVASLKLACRPFDIEGGNVVTDIRYDATTKQLQKKTMAVPTWTMIEGGQAEDCP